MILYHGTNIDFEKIVLSLCKPNKDFGRGFYLTDIKNQASQMAVRRCDFSKKGSPIVQEYEIDDSVLKSGELKVKVFETVSTEWAEFVLMNRRNKQPNLYDYDVVIGPIADDGVVLQLNLYERHLIDISQLVKGLTYHDLNSQFCFRTEKSVKYLRRIE